MMNGDAVQKAQVSILHDIKNQSNSYPQAETLHIAL
jgi:hypothetical protein